MRTSYYVALCYGGQEPWATRIDRVWLATRWIILGRWRELCTYAGAQNPHMKWPLNKNMGDAVHELVDALAKHGINWLAAPVTGWNASSLLKEYDMSLECHL
jgi:hypothetical protein